MARHCNARIAAALRWRLRQFELPPLRVIPARRRRRPLRILALRLALAGLGGDATAYVPGVTDSGTGVLRERERRGIEPTAASTAGSGFDLVGDDGAVALAGALAAAAVAASLALGAGARRRRILT